MLEDIELSYDGETARLSALADLDILDTPPEHEFDTIVEYARQTLSCKIALVSLVDEHRQWFKAKVRPRRQRNAARPNLLRARDRAGRHVDRPRRDAG